MPRTGLKNIAKLIGSVTEEVSIQDAFLHDLKRSIELTDERTQRKPSQTYKPSGMNCIRASYYQIKGIDPDPAKSSYTLVGICNSGTDIHVRIQQAVESMLVNGMDCEYVDVAKFVTSRNLDHLEIVGKSGEETKLYDTVLNISFLCDGIIKYKKKYYIIEFKTENSFKWNQRTGVDPSHYQQATTYSLELGLEDVMFVYISRDNLDMKCYLYHVTDEMRQGIIDYVETCNNYIRVDTVPAKNPVSTKACTYCAYKERCNKDGD